MKKPFIRRVRTIFEDSVTVVDINGVEHTHVINRVKEPTGVIVALSKELVGWSYKNPKDKWNDKLGIEIATMRALQAKNRFELYAEMPNEMHYALEKTLEIIDKKY